MSISKLTVPNEEQFLKDADLLGIKLPQEIPRFFTSVDQAIYIISRLLEQGQAYWHKGDVFFDPLTFYSVASRLIVTFICGSIHIRSVCYGCFVC